MNAQKLTIDEMDVRKILGAANPYTALLYFYIYSGNDPEAAEEALHFSKSQYTVAAATLRQLGLWPEEERKVRFIPGERPAYSEEDVILAMQRDFSFRGLYEEVQRVLGRSLNTEELKILLGFIRYLGLPVDVVTMLINYCRFRSQSRGSGRNPSLRMIEKEAYIWAEKGIDTLEEASAYIQNQNMRNSRIYKVMEILQIRGRSLTQAEEKYAQSWIEMGFDDGAIAMAFERTCLNIGGLNWKYMNSILQRWAEQRLYTAEAITSGDKRDRSVSANKERRPDDDERAAIMKLMQGNE